MRGSGYCIEGLPQAVAVLDLSLAGVGAEMSDEAFDWFAAAGKPKSQEKSQSQSQAQPQVHPAAVGVDAAPKPVMRVAPPLVIPSDSEMLAPAPRPKVVLPVMEAGAVWVEDDRADVVMVVQGDKPDARSKALATAMLAAVGLPEAVVGWVGFDGLVPAEELRQAVVGLGAKKVLVMGQGPLGILLGRNLGVEGWQAAGGAERLGFEGAVGVTYPLDLLLKQPLFKRLAWQHLLAWQEGF